MWWIVLIVWIPITVAIFVHTMKKSQRQLDATFPPLAPEDVRFQELRASGRSLQKLFTRLGGAANTLDVVVTREELWIRLSWPFRLVFSGAESDLMHRIPLSRLTSVKPSQSWDGRRVEIQFTDGSNEIHTLELRLRRQDEFLALVPPRNISGPSSLLRPAENTNNDESLVIPVSSSEPPLASNLLKPVEDERLNHE